MVSTQQPPDGWEALAVRPGASYSAAHRPRFVNLEAGVTVEVTLDDDGPEYRADVLCGGRWLRLLSGATHDEAVDSAYGFMQWFN